MIRDDRCCGAGGIERSDPAEGSCDRTGGTDPICMRKAVRAEKYLAGKDGF